MGNLFARRKTHWVPVNRVIAHRIETVADWTDKMDFSSMQIQNDPMAKEMIMKFSMCETLIEVNLSFNGLGDAECIPIAKAIRESRTMRRLYHFNNNIHAKGAQALAFALMQGAGQGDPSLEELSLRNNIVGAEGAQGLALVFSCNKRLKKMDLHWNNIRNVGLHAICMNLPAAPLPADFRVVSHVCPSPASLNLTYYLMDIAGSAVQQLQPS